MCIRDRENGIYVFYVEVEEFDEYSTNFTNFDLLATTVESPEQVEARRRNP